MDANVVDDYGWNSESGPESCGYIAPRVVDLLKRIDAKRVLDLGAGNGVLCRELAKHGFDVVGVEYDRGGIDIARRTVPHVPFYCFGVQDDPSLLIETELPFDAVVSTEVIEHLFSPHLLPQYARGVLRQGGHLLLSTPYHGYLKNLALAMLGKWDSHHTALWHGGHIKFWSRATLGELIESNGFAVQGFSGVGRIPYLWKSMVLVARST